MENVVLVMPTVHDFPVASLFSHIFVGDYFVTTTPENGRHVHDLSSVWKKEYGVKWGGRALCIQGVHEGQEREFDANEPMWTVRSRVHRNYY
jgi:hypothetical protein